MNNSFLELSCLAAGANLSEIFFSFLVPVDFLASSLAFLAASLAILPFKALLIILTAPSLFSSR